MSRILAATAAAVLLGGLAVAAPAAEAAPVPRAAAVPAPATASVAPASLHSADRLAAAFRASRSASRFSWKTPSYAKWFASRRLASTPGWGAKHMKCLSPMWAKESEWLYRARSGPYYGIPQTTSGEIRRAGYTVSQFVKYPEVQVIVGLRYIKSRYGSPCSAWSFWQSHGWY